MHEDDLKDWGDGKKWGDKEPMPTVGELAEAMNEEMAHYFECITVTALKKIALLGTTTMEMEGLANEIPEDFPKDFAMRVHLDTVEGNLKIAVKCKGTLNGVDPTKWEVTEKS